MTDTTNTDDLIYMYSPKGSLEMYRLDGEDDGKSDIVKLVSRDGAFVMELSRATFNKEWSKHAFRMTKATGAYQYWHEVPMDGADEFVDYAMQGKPESMSTGINFDAKDTTATEEIQTEGSNIDYVATEDPKTEQTDVDGSDPQTGETDTVTE